MPATILVFDWGDTLMRVFPDFDGPMVGWPEVAAVDGAAAALHRLKGRYRLYVGTNAANSSAAQVLAALDRVGLAQFFEQVLTVHELGSLKPQPAFFGAVEEKLGAQPGECVMIGDDLKADVLGALHAGWRAVWYNPESKAAPGLTPLHDREIHRLEELPAILRRPDLPSLEICLIWLQEQGSPQNLIKHVQTVAATAYQLALWMRAGGEPLDPVLAHRGGMLHDLAKMRPESANPKGLSHGELAGVLLEKRNQPELAEIARRHMLFALLEGEQPPATWEQKLVYFADKLVEGSRLVSFTERMDALNHRYQIHDSRIEALLPRLEDMQAELCFKCGIAPDDLLPRLEMAMQGN